jgi:phenylacetate-CoA ligase
VSAYTWLCARVVFPLHEQLKGHDSVRRRRELEDSQWWPRDRLDALRRARLAQLLRDARQHVPYYRDALPESVAGTRDPLALLPSLPFLDKAIIREQGERMKSRTARRLRKLSTGGSTGEPLTFWVGAERVSHDVAAKWRATRWWGVDIGDPEVVLWGSPIEVGAQDRIRGIRDRVFRTTLLPAFRMSDAQMSNHLARIVAIRPAMLFGYPSALALLAQHAHERAVDVGSLGVRVVFCTGETLLDTQRALLEDVFRAPVANGYGARDAGFIAHQCPSGTLHLSAEDVIIEIVDASGHPLPEGQEGEIVVTHLATTSFPMIRYRTGDIGTLHSGICGCGRTLPALSAVRGRSTDLIRTTDGNIMHALALIYVLRERPEVRAFKIIQESLQELRVQVVPGLGFGADVVEAIRQGLLARMGEGTRIFVDTVTAIEPEKSGKYRYVVSRVTAGEPQARA